MNESNPGFFEIRDDNGGDLVTPNEMVILTLANWFQRIPAHHIFSFKELKDMRVFKRGDLIKLRSIIRKAKQKIHE